MEKKIDTSVRTTDETSEETMEETMQRKTVVNHFEAGANCQVFNGNITGCVFSTARRVDEMTTRRVDEMTDRRVDEEEPQLSTLVACVAKVRDMFWADSAMAVIFCVCRDNYNYANNMSQFERDFQCKEGLLSNTFSDNPYMRKNISSWEKNGAKRRVLKLVEAYKNAVEGGLEE